MTAAAILRARKNKFIDSYGERAFRDQPRVAMRFCRGCLGWESARYEHPYIIGGQEQLLDVYDMNDILNQAARWYDLHNFVCHLDVRAWLALKPVLRSCKVVTRYIPLGRYPRHCIYECMPSR